MGRGPHGRAGGRSSRAASSSSEGPAQIQNSLSLSREGACSRQAGGRQRGRDARAARRGALPRQPLVRAHGRGARRRGAAARGRRDPARREPLRRRAPKEWTWCRRRPRPISSARRSRGAGADVVVMAAAVADYRPAAAIAGKRPEGRRPVGARAGADRRRPARARRAAHERPGARRLRGRARRGGLERARDEARSKRARPGRLQRRVARPTSASTAPTTRSSSSAPTASAACPQAEQARDRGGDPRRGRAPAGGTWTRRREPGRAGRRARPRRSTASSPTSGASCTRPSETLRLCVLCLVAEGHLIIEDFPGVGKTMLAKALARSVDCSLLAPPVHARPAADGRHRRQRLQPAR